jgi:diacylglycerol kinase
MKALVYWSLMVFSAVFLIGGIGALFTNPEAFSPSILLALVLWVTSFWFKEKDE